MQAGQQLFSVDNTTPSFLCGNSCCNKCSILLSGMATLWRGVSHPLCYIGQMTSYILAFFCSLKYVLTITGDDEETAPTQGYLCRHSFYDLKGGRLLALSHCRGNRSKSIITEFYATPIIMSKGVLLQCHTARRIGDCNHWILRQTSLLH